MPSGSTPSVQWMKPSVASDAAAYGSASSAAAQTSTGTR